jgi:hypothetical protein
MSLLPCHPRKAAHPDIRSTYAEHLTGVRAGLCTKEERAAKMGMTALTSDVAAQRRALQTTFLEAESCAASRLAEVDAVRAAVENACGIKLIPLPAQTTVRPPQD